MTNKELQTLSKHLSCILRHKPELAHVELDSQGYTEVSKILSYFNIDKEILDSIVETDEKKRYSYKEINGILCIRANQGHSVKNVQIDFDEYVPVGSLYHGTARKFMNDILKEGLTPQSRNMVHLSLDVETAKKVGLRHSKSLEHLVVLEVDAVSMYNKGYKFYISENKVVQISNVPVEFLNEIEL